MAERLAIASDLPPEFDSVDSRDLTYWLAQASAVVTVDAWGELTSFAHATLASHYLKLAGKGSDSSTGTGPVTSERVGDVSVSYAAAAVSAEGDLGTTHYGRRYLDLQCKRGELFVGPIAIRSNDLTLPLR